MYLYIELLLIGGSRVDLRICACACDCLRVHMRLCTLTVHNSGGSTQVNETHTSEYNNCHFWPQISILSLGVSFTLPLPFQLLCSLCVHHHSEMIDGAVETVNVKVCEPWTERSAWISVAQSKCRELDEPEQERRQHFPSHAFSLSQIESYYLTLLFFPQWPNNIVSAILSSLWPHDFTQESVRWRAPLLQRCLVVFSFLLLPRLLV